MGRLTFTSPFIIIQIQWLDPGPRPDLEPENGTHFGHGFEPELGPRRALGLCPFQAAATGLGLVWLDLAWVTLPQKGMACPSLAWLALACSAVV